MSKVKVTADAAGNAIIVSKKNSEYGYIRVVQDRFLHDERGFVRNKPISALVVGLITVLRAMGWKAEQLIEGKVIFKESLIPFNEKEPERDYKIAGKTGIICVVDGQPIYRKTFYTTDPEVKDEKVEHTNGQEIIDAYAKLEENETMDLGKI